ncbi:MAG TPA: hypothetical protein VFZ00_12265 [Solirubrobacter sp.]|nr:hypothetical protein [Solirubrobacter sp.]
MKVEVRAHDPHRVEVAIVNDGPEPVTVNARLAPGYRDSSSRELFADVFDGDRQVAVPALDYDRHPPQRDDYVELAPGEQLTTSFDLRYWYRVPPGDYELVVYYQADEPLALDVPRLERGTHASERVPLSV